MPEHQQTQKYTESKTTSQKQATLRIQAPVSHPMAIIQRARINPKSLTHADVMQLQQTIGNRAVVRLLTEIGAIPSKAKQAPPVQRQELVQRQEIPEEEEPLQGKMIETIQRQEIPEEEEPLQGKFTGTVQRQEIPEEEEPLQTKRENNTGMPDNLKAGVESLSGIDMSDVRVHYNSSRPAEVGALAYTQGTNIHVAPGQERHLPHEAWHVVQQIKGEVHPTIQVNGFALNNDSELEKEADVMGKRSIQMRPAVHFVRSNLFSIHADYTGTAIQLADTRESADKRMTKAMREEEGKEAEEEEGYLSLGDDLFKGEYEGVYVAPPARKAWGSPSELEGDLIEISKNESLSLEAKLRKVIEIARDKHAIVGYEQVKTILSTAEPQEKQSLNKNRELISEISHSMAPDPTGYNEVIKLVLEFGNIMQNIDPKFEKILSKDIDSQIIKWLTSKGITIGEKGAKNHYVFIEKDIFDLALGGVYGIKAVKDIRGLTALNKIFITDAAEAATVIHETFHFYSNRDFEIRLGTTFKEGTTELFTRKMLPIFELSREKYAYDIEFDKVSKVENVVGEDYFLKGYFLGDLESIEQILLCIGKPEFIKTFTDIPKSPQQTINPPLPK
jgi:hypothetical protein